MLAKDWMRLHMLKDDKVTAGETINPDNDINTRDQRRAGVWLLVLTLLFFAFLVALGASHSPQNPALTQHPQDMSITGGKPMGTEVQAPDFSINQPIGWVERPGTVGKPQHF